MTSPRVAAALAFVRASDGETRAPGQEDRSATRLEPGGTRRPRIDRTIATSRTERRIDRRPFGIHDRSVERVGRRRGAGIAARAEGEQRQPSGQDRACSGEAGNTIAAATRVARLTMVIVGSEPDKVGKIAARPISYVFRALAMPRFEGEGAWFPWECSWV